MKRTLWIFICLFVSMIASAQTQQGIVKTRGRMVNGQLQPGKGLSGATVQVKNRSAVVSNNNGAFSFPIPSQTYLLQSVQKNGYQLVDADALIKPYNYSANPLCLVMETPEQQMEDKLDAERKIRRTLQQQLQKREDELEELKAQNKLTLAEYQNAMQLLYENQQNNEKLIADMAKEYAQMDYDQMDELNQQISDAIINGRLTEADSLLRSKGDINTRIVEIQKKQQLEAREESELVQRQQNLEASKAGTQKRLEDLAQDCKNYSDRYKMSNQYDSAAFYIDLRAGLEPMQIDWLFDAAVFHARVNHFEKAETYYRRVISYLEENDTKDTHENSPMLCVTLNNLGILYNRFHHAQESELTYQKALEICRQLKESDPTYEPMYAQTLNNLAVLKFDLGLLQESETMFSEVLAIREKWVKVNEMVYKPQFAQTLNNLGNLYFQTQRLSQGESLYLRVLTLYQELIDEGNVAFEADKAATLSNLGALYQHTGQVSASKSNYREAMAIFSRLAKDAPISHESSLKKVVEVLLGLISEKNENNYREKLDIYRLLAKDNPERYIPFVAQTLNTFADYYDNSHQLDKSEPLYTESLDIYKQLTSLDANTYTSYVARAFGNLSFHYLLTKDYEKAERYAREALTTDANKIFAYANLAHSLLFQGRYQEAEAIYDKYRKDLKKMFLDDFQKFKENDVIPNAHKDFVEQIITKLDE